jgi:WhiB family redox-sensing transcriptional regulator
MALMSATAVRTIARRAAEPPAEIWMDGAECVGNWELFFPDHADPGPAKRICQSCAVRRQCLAYALMSEERHGIWGGMTPGERRSHSRRVPLGRREGSG